MREKELRIALVCYGGVSLAVYMHGITKEVWRVARASRSFHGGDDEAAPSGSEAVYLKLFQTIADRCEVELRVLVDILAGASAGGINAVFLAHAISTGCTLDPLTDLWLDSADVDRLIDTEVSGVSRMAKSAAIPFAWALSARSGTVEKTVEPAHRAEIRTKLANFVRGRWFAPPFGGPILTNLILDAFETMERGSATGRLLPEGQPLDLFVSVTDFHGHPEQLRLNSPPEVTETEHRVTLAFSDKGNGTSSLADPAELTFAARATASFPGAFPPFRVDELDRVLDERSLTWPGRSAFLQQALPQHSARGEAEAAVLIDGSVLANAPFAPAIAALERRPARREVDRRFVYIDPKPGLRSVRLISGADKDLPGFFTSIFGAMSDIPREQPIRDNLEDIDRISGRIRRLRHIVDSMRPEVEAAIHRAVGTSFFLVRPTPRRLAAWRARVHELSAREAGYAYAAYGQLKIAAVVEEVATAISRLAGGTDRPGREQVRQAVWSEIRSAGLTSADAVTARGARADVVEFLVDFDLHFRTRRLRSVARHLTEKGSELEGADGIRRILNEMTELYRARVESPVESEEKLACLSRAESDPRNAMAALASHFDLRPLDDEVDRRLAEALSTLPRADRRAIILSYLGYPYYDVATLPMLQGEGLDEFDPIKVDRISPLDATAIRASDPQTTLKGIQFNSFGAFFCRAYRENDYLWGRLHGADRMIDIMISSIPSDRPFAEGEVAEFKRQAFRAIIREEKPRLTSVSDLVAELEREIG
ncbi:MAG TPA: patatin-like protein [Allosphingosinicella sp.]|nr:patatin-like protein [Allosphingosinicella sp.]